MEERNELNDIILNKTEKKGSNKKLLVAIATFAIILIIVVVVMNKLGGSQESNLPHPPKQRAIVVEEIQEPDYAERSVPVIENSIEHTSELVEEDVVEDVDVIPEDDNVLEEPVYEKKTVQKPKSKPVVKAKKKVTKTSKPKAKTTRPSGKYNPKKQRVEKSKAVEPSKPVAATKGSYYVQVGSFAKYAPSKKFLSKIEKHGYTYTYHKVTRNSKTLNKVLVGPFKTKAAAREALPVIKRSIVRGAFLTKI